MQASIPDMWSTTALYLEVCRLYRAKADADAAAVQRHVSARLQQLGAAPGQHCAGRCAHVRAPGCLPQVPLPDVPDDTPGRCPTCLPTA